MNRSGFLLDLFFVKTYNISVNDDVKVLVLRTRRGDNKPSPIYVFYTSI